MKQLHKLIAALFILSLSYINAQTNIDTSSFNAVFSQLDLKPTTIVAIGEAHTIRGTHNTELLIIKRLVEKGYKTIYIEGGEAEITIMNMYLKTGDTTVLSHTRAREHTGELMKFMKGLYKLHEQHRDLTLKGFDFENPEPLNYLFSIWFDTTTISDPLVRHQVKLLQSIDRNISFWDDKKMRKVEAILRLVADSFATTEHHYRAILGENFVNFKSIIFNPVTSNFGTRNDNMTKVALRHQQEGDLDHSIIITGAHHMIYYHKNFIPLLAKGLPEQYTIASFACIYKNCRYYGSTKTYTSRPRFKKHLVKDNIEPLVHFTKPEKKLVPTKAKNMSTIAIGFYNQ